MSEQLQSARQKLECWLEQMADLHPNDYKRELDAVIAEALEEKEVNRWLDKLSRIVAAEITDDGQERAAQVITNERFEFHYGYYPRGYPVEIVLEDRDLADRALTAAFEEGPDDPLEDMAEAQDVIREEGQDDE